MFECPDKTNQMNSSVGQLSAVAAMLQFSSNKQGTMCEVNQLVAMLPSVAYSKANSGSSGPHLVY